MDDTQQIPTLSVDSAHVDIGSAETWQGLDELIKKMQSLVAERDQLRVQARSQLEQIAYMQSQIDDLRRREKAASDKIDSINDMLSR